MRILGTICAREGSKGLKNKNIKSLLGKPLISYSINVLKKWGKADRIICSTDSEQIQRIAREYGAETPFLRPARLSTDDASKLDVLKHLLLYCEDEKNTKYDYIIDLDPTSPLRTVKDLNKAYEKFKKHNGDVIVSVYNSHKNPYFNMLELDDKYFAHLIKKADTSIVSRQQAPRVYSMNASIYIYKRDYLISTSSVLAGKVLIYEMPDITIDIDREIDFEFLEFILNRRLFKFDY